MAKRFTGLVLALLLLLLLLDGVTVELFTKPVVRLLRFGASLLLDKDDIDFTDTDFIDDVSLSNLEENKINFQFQFKNF
jgi:hypothetical protein